MRRVCCSPGGPATLSSHAVRARISQAPAGNELLLAFASHAAVSLERAEFLEEQARTREWEASLEIARQVQISFLPRALPPIAGYGDVKKGSY